MASSSSNALWNEVARIISTEFFENGQPITGLFLMEIIRIVQKQLTEE